MSEHRVQTQVTTSCGDVWVGCVCGWVSPPLRGTSIADAAFLLHTLRAELDGANPHLSFF